MSNCGMCGALIPAGAGACAVCGFEFTADGMSPDTLMPVAQWGRLKFDLSRIENAQEIAERFRQLWLEHEKYSALSFFPGQFDLVPSPGMEFSLYAPKDVFMSLKKTVLRSDSDDVALSFTPISEEELSLLLGE